VPVQTWISAREALLALWIQCLDTWGWGEPTAAERTMLRRHAAGLLLQIESDPANAWGWAVDSTDLEIGFIHCFDPVMLPRFATRASAERRAAARLEIPRMI
jgi:hypothetical protein